jgi:hypothetical protein
MRTPSGKRSSNNTLLLIIINKQADMLRSRLYTLPSQTYLHQPIKYRQLQMFMDAFADLVGDLTPKRRAAFSGRKKSILKISMNRVPKGMISTIARM